MERTQPVKIAQMPVSRTVPAMPRRFPVQVRATFIRLPRPSAA